MAVESKTLLAGGGAGGTALAYGHVKTVATGLLAWLGVSEPEVLDSSAELLTAVVFGFGGGGLLALTNLRQRIKEDGVASVADEAGIQIPWFLRILGAKAVVREKAPSVVPKEPEDEIIPRFDRGS